MNTIATVKASERRVGNERRSRLGLLQEPAGYVDGQNLYEYVRSRPVTLVDPLGMQATTGPATTQPAPVDGSKKTDIGTFEWHLSVSADKVGYPQVQFRLRFAPDKTKCMATHVAVVQVVLEFSSGGKAIYPYGDEEYYKQFVSNGGSWLDHDRGETDPYYNAILKGNEWVSEGPFNFPGNGPSGKATSMFDKPAHRADFVGRWEAIVVDMKSQKTYGGIKWGYKSTQSGTPALGSDGKLINPPKISDLTASFVETPSDEWRSAVEKWNEVARQHPDWSQYPVK